VAGEDLAARIDRWFGDDCFHDVSISGIALEDAADVRSTDWDIYRHSLDPTEWRERQRELGRFPDDLALDDPAVRHGDVPFFGDRYLRLETKLAGNADEFDAAELDRERRALKALLSRYTATDVERVFDVV
jgi:hypothetical protein